MKSYTSIEQSEKLAKILPIESADLYYHLISPISVYGVKVFDNIPDFKNVGVLDLPCWSAAALINVLPETILHEYENEHKYLSIEKHINGFYIVAYENSFVKGNKIQFREVNLVDACVNMILKLHELKML